MSNQKEVSPNNVNKNSDELSIRTRVAAYLLFVLGAYGFLLFIRLGTPFFIAAIQDIWQGYAKGFFVGFLFLLLVLFPLGLMILAAFRLGRDLLKKKIKAYRNSIIFLLLVIGVNFIAYWGLVGTITKLGEVPILLIALILDIIPLILLSSDFKSWKTVDK